MSSVEKRVRDPARLWKLQELHILDSAPEAEFDDAVKIASAVCKTPIALVSLVDAHRQWFKAKIGLDLNETPLEQAVCAHALDQDDILEIDDLADDPRTRANGLVTADDGIRFYAGAPLRTKDGYVLGTLCVIDRQSRPGGLNPEQRDALSALARQVLRLLEMRRVLENQEASTLRDRRQLSVMRKRGERNEQARQKSINRQFRQQEAQEAGRIGTFEIDLGEDSVKVSPEFCRIFGLPEADAYTIEQTVGVVHPEDRTISSNAQNRQSATAERDVEYRIIRPSDGKMRWIARRASFDFDANGQPIRMLGTVHDITERRFAHERMRYLLELGDRLHIAESIEEAAEAAGDSLRKAFSVSRAGYATVDLAGGRVTVEQDSCNEGIDSVKGWRPISEYPETVAKMREGEPVAITDVRTLKWLQAEVPGYVDVGAIAQLWIPISVHGILVGSLFAQHNEPRFWTLEEREFAESVAYRTYMTIAKLQAQAEQAILNQELGHRIKNMLAMIMALATQSLKHVKEQSAVETFRKRLLALGTAHEDLLRHNWSGGSLESILRGVLGRLVVPERVALKGPEIVLGPRAALSLSLMAHELGTNALKYGALSTDRGKVAIEWWTENGSETEKLVLRWSETGGPPVVAPEGSGFGSQLIEMGLMGTGDAQVAFNSKGLVAEFTAPLQLARRL